MSRKKLVFVICGCVLIAGIIIGVIFLGLYLKDVQDYKDKVNNIQIGDINISELQDGIYTGEYDVGFIYAKVEVTVISGRITKIRLIRHDNDKGAAAEDITDTVIREQLLQVDAVSGATNSSKTILKAIEEALQSEPRVLD